ncbi:amidohydrolase [Flavilitoribacter nigricans]|uniref:amidohydrolase n=1 Tax=Flavilitoribacter nigricans TaxID=70997 RepID=UPI001F4734B3|nr:amidohydrolase [Flavilitoribacter nigricans]
MPTEKIRVTQLQADLHWEDKPANLRMFDEKIAAIGNTSDLIVLPEMFTTGFSMNAAALAEPMDSATLQHLSKWAAASEAVVTGSFIAVENDHFFNRLVWMQPDGNYHTYDKRHLFTLADEHLTYTAGAEKLIVELMGWKVCPLICYDLRFPVWSRNTEAYDLLLYVANFPAKRSAAWKSLLTARAIENQVYTIGVNRVGTDGKGHYYSGDSCLVDFEGRVLYRASHIEDCFTTDLSYSAQLEFRQRFAFLADRDDFSIV